MVFYNTAILQNLGVWPPVRPAPPKKLTFLTQTDQRKPKTPQLQQSIDGRINEPQHAQVLFTSVNKFYHQLFWQASLRQSAVKHVRYWKFLKLTSPMSSATWQRYPFCHVQCRAPIDKSYYNVSCCFFHFIQCLIFRPEDN